MTGLGTPRSSPGLERPRIETARRVFVARTNRWIPPWPTCQRAKTRLPVAVSSFVATPGTGKTFFLQNLLHRAGEEEPQGLYLYIDIANDEYQSAQGWSRW